MTLSRKTTISYITADTTGTECELVRSQDEKTTLVTPEHQQPSTTDGKTTMSYVHSPFHFCFTEPIHLEGNIFFGDVFIDCL